MRWVAALLITGCTSTGALELQLDLPSQPELRPSGMTTITVITTAPGRDPIANTSVFGETFSAGDLPVGGDIRVAVELRDEVNRLVGVGEAAEAVDVTGEAITTLVIPVRRPFVYAASGSALYSFDPTLDPADAKFQGQVAGVPSPRAVVSLGADRLVVAGTNQVQVISTMTNTVTGMIAVPAGVRDLAPLPGARGVAIAHDRGISIVDLDTSIVTDVPVGPVDHVVASTRADGREIVYGLIGRVAPATSAITPCSGASSLVALALDDPGAAVIKPLGVATSAIAAAPGRLFAALPCSGKLAAIEGDVLGLGPVTATDLAQLPGAAALTVQGDRLVAVGTRPSSLQCQGSSGVAVLCTAAVSDACPAPAGVARIGYAREGAQLILVTLPLAGGQPTTVMLAEQREAVASNDDASGQLTQNLYPIGSVPLDVVALRGDNSVAVVTENSYYIDKLIDGLGGDIFPCVKATTSTWMIIDLARAAAVSQVRTRCTIVSGTGAVFGGWECGNLPTSETSAFGDYAPISVGALLGAR